MTEPLAKRELIVGQLTASTAQALTMPTPAPFLRSITEEPTGPVELLVMALAKELHDREHLECDWFSHNGSSVTSFCRRACEARGLDWKWVYAAIERERLDEKTELR